jgi:hypothetical protein
MAAAADFPRFPLLHPDQASLVLDDGPAVSHWRAQLIGGAEDRVAGVTRWGKHRDRLHHSVRLGGARRSRERMAEGSLVQYELSDVSGPLEGTAVVRQ